jgi:hypothetical protein
MIPYIGDFAEDATVIHYFNTFSSDDPAASITMTTLVDTDLYVYKDGNIADLVTDGASVVIDFDGRTGIHKLTIDTSVHADYAVGSDYMIIIEGATVDGGNITAAIFTFSIENRFDAAFDRIGVAGAGLTDLGGMSTGMKAEVEVEANDALVANHLDHLLAVDYDPASKPGVGTALLNELVENNGGVSRYTAASLANAPGGSASTTLLNSTTISATGFVSQTQFRLNAGPTDDGGGLVGQMAIITDQATSTQKAVGLVATYTGATKEVILDVDPGVFTMAIGDTIDIFAVSGSQIPLEIDASGRVDVGSVAGTAQTSGDLAALSVQIDTVVDGIQNDLSNGTDGLGALSTDIATAQADLDILTGSDGATLATAQANYAPATAASLATTDGKVDDILADTGTTGVVIAAAQTVATVTDVTNLHASAATAAALATVDTNVDNINLGIIYGTSVTGTLSTTVSTSDLTGYLDDELIGREIIWTSGTADGQAASITDYAATNGTITYGGGITTARLGVGGSPRGARDGAGGIVAELTGTFVPSLAEAVVVSTGGTVIVTLTDDTFIAAGTGPIGTTAQSQAFIDGLVASTTPINGWNNTIRDVLVPATDLSRDSDTQATFTIPATAGYDVGSNETITCTIPEAILVTSGANIVATPAFQIIATATTVDIFALTQNATRNVTRDITRNIVS